MEKITGNNAATKTITINIFGAECPQLLPEIEDTPFRTWFWLNIEYQKG